MNQNSSTNKLIDLNPVYVSCNPQSTNPMYFKLVEDLRLDYYEAYLTQVPLVHLSHLKHSNLLAHCRIYPIMGLFSDDVSYYMITDVLVPREKRGNGYAGVLLMNTLLECSKRYHPKSEPPPFRIMAHPKNQAALKCYEKIFGKPYFSTRRFIYFSSDPKDYTYRGWRKERIWEWYVERDE
jgi:hypothetical protein